MLQNYVKMPLKLCAAVWQHYLKEIWSLKRSGGRNTFLSWKPENICRAAPPKAGPGEAASEEGRQPRWAAQACLELSAGGYCPAPATASPLSLQALAGRPSAPFCGQPHCSWGSGEQGPLHSPQVSLQRRLAPRLLARGTGLRADGGRRRCVYRGGSRGGGRPGAPSSPRGGPTSPQAEGGWGPDSEGCRTAAPLVPLAAPPGAGSSDARLPR